MMCVSSDGYIVATYGPYSARKNDASILEEIMNQQRSIFNNLQSDDLIIVDRGFRDCVNKLKRRNFQVTIFKYVLNTNFCAIMVDSFRDIKILCLCPDVFCQMFRSS